MRVHRYGADALLVEVDGHHAALALYRAAREHRVAARDVVPAARSVLFDGVADPDRLERELLTWAHDAEPATGRLVEVPTRYDGEDLGEVARLWDMTARRRWSARTRGWSTRWRSAASPPGSPTARVCPTGCGCRAGTTRGTRVPAGSVAVADLWTGVYPTASPGGWRCSAAPRCSCGTRRATSPRPCHRGPACGSWRRERRALVVEDPGPLTTVQDRADRAGRTSACLGQVGSTAPAAGLANRLVGNDGDAAVLETTLGGVTVRTTAAMTVAVTGAECTLRVAGRARPFATAVPVPAGAVVHVGPARSGVRSYLAVSGGVAVEPVLGSRSTDTLAGVGPPPLTAGAELPVGPAQGRPSVVDAHLARRMAGPAVLRVLAGPHADRLGRTCSSRSAARPGPRRSAPTGWLCASTARPCPATTARSPPKAWCSGRSRCRRRGSRWCSSPTTPPRAATRSWESCTPTTSRRARSCAR